MWGRDPAKAAALAQELGTRPFPESDVLIGAVDAVSVALPPAVQPALAIRAADAGRHLLLDKPLALDLAAADAVVEAVDRAGVSSLVFFTARFTGHVATFLRDVAGRSWEGGRSTHGGSIFGSGNPYGSSPWRREKGGLWDVGPHALALVLPVLGPVRDVAAMAGPRPTTHVLLRHESGAVSHLTLTVDAPPAHFGYHTEFSGPDGPSSCHGRGPLGRRVRACHRRTASGRGGGRDVTIRATCGSAGRWWRYSCAPRRMQRGARLPSTDSLFRQPPRSPSREERAARTDRLQKLGRGRTAPEAGAE